MRIGVGYDSHRFDDARPLILGGVEIPDVPGLRGHSDGDAIAHAVTDALLGAAGLGDIGALFPDTDPETVGADSLELLAGAVRRIESENYQVVNVDVTVVAEAPAIGPHARAMRERLAGVLHAPPAAVSIKGKSNEGMGWIGRGEGIAVIAVVSIDQIGDIDALLASIRSGGG
ncbi:MAG: 2-C-methyl-D-erythritol 2,4-cyclodiphosphate synthase [Gemmatimonadota bacterium]|nr:2-C-methyl-D-erythritol 2,4-cyclodiphosphate synthase [Gemmatimonadota bacterium]